MAQEHYATVETLAAAITHPDIKPDFRVTIPNSRTIAIGPPDAPRQYMFDLADERLISSGEPRRGLGDENGGFNLNLLPPGKANRITGRFTFVHGSVEFARNSLADILEAVLVYLEERKPGTLAQLSAVKKRTRRIVSRDRAQLFDRAHLANKHARKIKGNWWMGTNNSKDETRKWISRACDIAGIDPVADVVIGL